MVLSFGALIVENKEGCLNISGMDLSKLDEETYNRKLKAHQESKKRSFERRKNRQLSKRIGYDFIDKSYNVREGHCKLSKHRSPKHEQAKEKVQHLAMRAGYKAYSEVIFINNRGIADIFLPEVMKVYEILESETMAEYKKKIAKYPPELEIIPLRVEDVLKDDFCL